MDNLSGYPHRLDNPTGCPHSPQHYDYYYLIQERTSSKLLSLFYDSVADFLGRCSFCPMKGSEDMCDAIRPTIPFLNIVDKYVSFDEVTAVFTGDDGILRVSFTAMQEALKYISILSLMNFCKKGKTYWKYFYGINPLMNPKEIAGRLCLNLHFINKDDREKIKEIVTKFNEEVTILSKNQIMRMNLVCKNDVFMNSFVNTQASAMFLSMDMDKKLEASIKEFSSSYKDPVIN